MNSKPLKTIPESRGVHQNTPNDTTTTSHSPPSRRRIILIHGIAVLLTLLIFYFQLLVIFDGIGEMLRYKPSLLAYLGPKDAGKIIVLGCFFALMSVHATQAAVWGLFLRITKLLPSITESIYFSSASITTLGYGDILLKHPWRHIGTLIAITGVLMFGCSTALLFLVLQDVWQHS